MFGENAAPDVNRARRSLCAWLSVPDNETASPREDWQFRTQFSGYHAEYPELVDTEGLDWPCRHVRDVCSFVEAKGQA